MRNLHRPHSAKALSYLVRAESIIRQKSRVRGYSIAARLRTQ
jgi:hypothetical protein